MGLLDFIMGTGGVFNIFWKCVQFYDRRKVKINEAREDEIKQSSFGEFYTLQAEPALLPDEWAAEHEAGTRLTFKINEVEFAFCYCPAGAFTMGTPVGEKGRHDVEKQRKVTFRRGFWMLETPVTQEQYKVVTQENPSDFSSSGRRLSRLNRVNGMDTSRFPVENVSWLECESYLEKLNILKITPENFEFRLPTEAEWEYACRAGTTGVYNIDCPLDRLGWYRGNSKKRTHEVCGKNSNAWGLYDMHGNVWEWCADWYAEYSDGDAIDPTGPDSGEIEEEERVLRGGSWGTRADRCRSACRNKNDEELHRGSYGFRFVLSPRP